MLACATIYSGSMAGCHRYSPNTFANLRKQTFPFPVSCNPCGNSSRWRPCFSPLTLPFSFHLFLSQSLQEQTIQPLCTRYRRKFELRTRDGRKFELRTSRGDTGHSPHPLYQQTSRGEETPTIRDTCRCRESSPHAEVHRTQQTSFESSNFEPSRDTAIKLQ